MIAVAMLLALVWFIACGGSTSSSQVSAIDVTPSPCGVTRTNSVQMSAVATLPDGTKENITESSETSWSTGNSQTATVNHDGIVVGVNAGITPVTAAYRGATGTVECTISP